MDKPVVISLVAPIYGVEKYIEKFAESVLGQTYPHVQYIFVNDGTKDASIGILETVISRHAHLRDRVLIVNKENEGLPAARKTGMEYVTGDYVWHVDSDDWVEDGALQRLADFIQAHDCPDVVYFDFFKEYSDRTKYKKESFFTVGTRDDYVRDMYNHRSFGCVWNKCVKRSLYRKAAVYFPQFSYGEDTFLMTQLVGRAESIAHLEMPLYHYRKDNPLAITRQNRRKRRREYALNFLDLYEKYRQVPSRDNPVSSIFDDILMQAGWYSVIYGFGLFRKYPYLAPALRHTRIRTGSNVPLPAQLMLRLIVLFCR